MSLFSKSSRTEDRPRRRGGCLKAFIICFVIYVVCSFIFGLMLGDMFSSSVTLEDNTVYVLQMKGQVAEQGQGDNPFGDLMNNVPNYSSPKIVGLDDLVSNIRFAKNNDKIKGIMLYGGELQIGFASAKALRDALIDYKESGKPLIAYASAYSQINYYIASVADTIYLNPVGSIDWNGLSAQKMYFKRLLDKIGVEMQVVKVGTFKSAVEPYILTEMSEADRKQTLQYVEGLWQTLLDGVAESRNIDQQQLNQYADLYMGVQPAANYVENGLVDRLIYTEDIDSLLINITGTKDYNKLTTSQLASVPRKAVKAKDKIALIIAEGEITDDEGDGIVGTKMVKQITKIRKNDDVKAVVLRVNSPGGSADASEQIWHAVQTLREKGLPVVVSMGDYAASGGYYISCGADYIYAEPNTLTGSIGIFGLIPNFGPLRDKVGVDIDGVSTNRFSTLNIDAQYRGMNSEQKELIQGVVNRGYDLFTSRCAEGRHTTQDSIKLIGEGRVWLGEKAVELGLVDELGNINSAIEKAAELASLTDYQIVSYPDKKDFLTELLEALDSSSEEERILMQLKELCKEPRIMMYMPFPTIE